MEGPGFISIVPREGKGELKTGGEARWLWGISPGTTGGLRSKEEALSTAELRRREKGRGT